MSDDPLDKAIMKKLARPPYRFTSRQIFDAIPPEFLSDTKPGERWLRIELKLEAMINRGGIHPQNGYFVRMDRMNRTPPERAKKPKKKNPKQTSFL